jgi:hypothetical protein
MGSLLKGVECAQSDRTLLLIGWLIEVFRKHDKFYQWGRECIEKFRGVLIECFFAFSFVVCQFLVNYWALQFSLTRCPFLACL